MLPAEAPRPCGRNRDNSDTEEALQTCDRTSHITLEKAFSLPNPRTSHHHLLRTCTHSPLPNTLPPTKNGWMKMTMKKVMLPCNYYLQKWTVRGRHLQWTVRRRTSTILAANMISRLLLWYYRKSPITTKTQQGEAPFIGGSRENIEVRTPAATQYAQI